VLLVNLLAALTFANVFKKKKRLQNKKKRFYMIQLSDSLDSYHYVTVQSRSHYRSMLFLMKLKANDRYVDDHMKSNLNETALSGGR